MMAHALTESQRRALDELDVLAARWEEVQDAMQSTIKHAAKKQSARNFALMDAIIADREAEDAMP